MKTAEITTRAREYAVAFCQVSLLNQIQSNQILSEKTEDFQTNAEIEQGPELASKAGVMADDGLLTSKNETQNSLVLPIVSEAARIKKMLWPTDN